MIKISKLGDKTLKEIVKDIYDEVLGSNLIQALEDGIAQGLKEDDIMKNLIKVIEPDLQDDKIRKIYNLFRIRPITIHGVPPPTEPSL